MATIIISYTQIHKFLIRKEVSWLQISVLTKAPTTFSFTDLSHWPRWPVASTPNHTSNSSSKPVPCPGHRAHLLVTVMLISPVRGVSSPSWGRGEIPEVRSGSRPRELSLASSPRADLRLTAWVLVSLSISNATLSVHGKFGCKIFPG